MKKVALVFLVICCCLSANAQETDSLETLNIPVILVDGVEVQSLDSISPDDIIEIKIIKDKKAMECFYPRVGGIIYITTKSKKFLSNIKREYKQNIEEIKKRKKDGVIYIR